MEENKELTTSYVNLEPSLHNAPITPAENTGNAHGADLCNLSQPHMFCVT